MGQDFSQFWIIQQTYFFFQLVLDSFVVLSSKSFSDHAGEKLWNSSWFVKPFSNNTFDNKHTEKDVRLYLRNILAYSNQIYIKYTYNINMKIFIN